MIKNRFVLSALCVLMGLSAGQATSQSIFGPKGKFSSFLSRLEWEPSCRKPDIPQSWSSDWEREQFPAEVRRWAQCVDSEAESDALYAADVISEGRRKAVSEFRRELELAR
ncbi:MAG: hypothetical protein KKG69_13260 [Alphaproteobacteria bacterium]|uniref:hypothetical protein n=1 Tax=Brevundimonas sp. TaxID=1871086 RepID=UPI0035624F18|nr:hypothetical protein [Alphaproteobacteria bacterium]MBU2166166.1 hypothetical protein [Alphaproteobacteria bacterium]MBU2232234.1 hypothetical protein [Alphaproteobacteria bacterium]